MESSLFHLKLACEGQKTDIESDFPLVGLDFVVNWNNTMFRLAKLFGESSAK